MSTVARGQDPDGSREPKRSFSLPKKVPPKRRGFGSCLSGGGYRRNPVSPGRGAPAPRAREPSTASTRSAACPAGASSPPSSPTWRWSAVGKTAFSSRTSIERRRAGTRAHKSRPAHDVDNLARSRRQTRRATSSVATEPTTRLRHLPEAARLRLLRHGYDLRHLLRVLAHDVRVLRVPRRCRSRRLASRVCRRCVGMLPAVVPARFPCTRDSSQTNKKIGRKQVEPDGHRSTRPERWWRLRQPRPGAGLEETSTGARLGCRRTVGKGALPKHDPIKGLLRYGTVARGQTRALRLRIFNQQLEGNVYDGAYWDIGTRDREPAVGYSKELIDKHIQWIRTDLDRFTEDEQKILENHGYWSVEEQFRKDRVRDQLGAILDDSFRTRERPHKELMDEDRVRRALRHSRSRFWLPRMLHLG